MSLRASQYGVSVIKYDRRGFKPRPRQLLLTNTFAVLVDKTKIKQRIDYAALRGENQPWVHNKCFMLEYWVVSLKPQSLLSLYSFPLLQFQSKKVNLFLFDLQQSKNLNYCALSVHLDDISIATNALLSQRKILLTERKAVSTKSKSGDGNIAFR